MDDGEAVTVELAFQSRESRKEGYRPTLCSEREAVRLKALGYVILTRKVTDWVEKDE